MNIKVKNSNNLIMYINILAMFFGYLFNLYTVLNFILIADVFFLLGRHIKLSKSSKIYFICVFIIFCITPFSNDFSLSMNFLSVLTCLGIIKICIESSIFELEKILDFVYILVLIHTIAVLAQYFDPTLVNSFNEAFLTGNYLTNYTLFLNNSYAGITGQTGVAAFYISIFIGMSYINYFYREKKNNIIYLFFLILGFCALFLTVKRSLILINIIIIVITLICTKKVNIKTVLKIVLVLAILYFVLKTIPFMDTLIKKMTILSEENDISNGREQMWQATLDLFNNNLLVGVGINTIESILHNQTHNIYLQLLAEVGIIGTVPFMTFFITSLTTTNYELRKKNNPNILLAFYVQLLFLFYGFVGNDFYSQLFLFPYLFYISITEKEIINQKEKRIKHEKSSNSYI